MNIDHGMSLRVAEAVADPTLRAFKVLQEFNMDEALPGDRQEELALETAQRLVDNATALLEQAKIYQKRLKKYARSRR